MKTSIILAAILATCSGCVNVGGKYTFPDGSSLSINTSRFLWRTENLCFTVGDTNKFNVSLSTKSSRPDVEAINALGEIAAKAIAAGK